MAWAKNVMWANNVMWQPQPRSAPLVTGVTPATEPPTGAAADMPTAATGSEEVLEAEARLGPIGDASAPRAEAGADTLPKLPVGWAVAEPADGAASPGLRETLPASSWLNVRSSDTAWSRLWVHAITQNRHCPAPLHTHQGTASQDARKCRLQCATDRTIAHLCLASCSACLALNCTKALRVLGSILATPGFRSSASSASACRVCFIICQATHSQVQPQLSQLHMNHTTIFGRSWESVSQHARHPPYDEMQAGSQGPTLGAAAAAALGLSTPLGVP